MRRCSKDRWLTTALVIVLSACSNDTSGPQGANTGLTARIDGAAWASEGSVALAVLGGPGLYVISGSQLTANGYIMSISLYNIPGTGTYPLGVGVTIPGGSVVLSNASGGWASPQSGADGTINITTLTSNRMEGTFNYVVNALTGSATGTRTVTDGVFQLPVRSQGTVGPLPDNAGSKVSATIAGAAWNAAVVVSSLSPGTSSSFVVAANNNARGLSISLGNIPGPGTYALAGGTPARQIGVTNVVNSTANVWSSLGPGGNGSVTITSITATRIRGTFSATLGPAQGSSTVGALTVTNGSFDLGRN
ncbi:MAG: hypothetical protein ACRENP_13445 [Longimicrobiales bacterium]